jgi:hypothetical protein
MLWSIVFNYRPIMRMESDFKERKTLTTLEKINNTNKYLLCIDKYLKFPKQEEKGSPIFIYRYNTKGSEIENDTICKLFTNERDNRLIHGDEISKANILVGTNLYVYEAVKNLVPKENYSKKYPPKVYSYRPDVFLVEEYGPTPLLFETLSAFKSLSKYYKVEPIPVFLLTDEGYKPVASFDGDSDLEHISIKTWLDEEYRVDNSGITMVERTNTPIITDFFV